MSWFIVKGKVKDCYPFFSYCTKTGNRSGGALLLKERMVCGGAEDFRKYTELEQPDSVDVLLLPHELFLPEEWIQKQ